MYVINIYYDDNMLGEAKYKTLPDENSDTPLIIVGGGDNGNSPLSTKMIKDSSNKKPDLIMVGGDLAYDNALCACAYTWDTYLA
mmetsp:Transcript_39560/g.35349  ORF Transcript_39560/g.35349 Transcript_39560/m.35349 type:complete len:84 (+) Transcript_39560:1023-1274(+)